MATPLYVSVWFDTEDYIAPEDGDATRRLAEMLTARGIPGTFKIVGEWARAQERRGRQDVFAALHPHDIGYHTDYHSVHPTVSELCRPLDWDHGAEAFVAQEEVGLRDVERLLGPCSCYGQAGASWAPQATAALRRWNIPLYLDEGEHVGLDEMPFFYGGLLHVFRLRRHCARLSWRGESADDLTGFETRFAQAAESLVARGGGVVSIFYHPCEWTTSAFWDGVNFARGANPPRAQWKPAPALTPEEQERRFQLFGAHLDSMLSRGDVEFVTGRDLIALYPDIPDGTPIPPDSLRRLAEGVLSETNSVTYAEIPEGFVSPAEALALLTDFLQSAEVTAPIPFRSILVGTTSRPAELSRTETQEWPAFAATLPALSAFLRAEGRVPAEIAVGGASVPPAPYLAACAKVVLDRLSTGAFPTGVTLAPTRLATTRCVGDDKDCWGWVIFPEDFHAPELLEMGQWLAWTLKPARLAPQ